MKILRFNDESEGGLNNEWDRKGWLRIYPELNDRPKILEQLSDQSGGFLKHLDLLVEENLLNVVSGDLYISSQSGHNDTFFCSQVASEEEVYKMSILQSLLLSLNLLLPKCKQNARGWNLIALGLHEIQNSLMEWAQTQHLTDDMKKILSSLLIAYANIWVSIGGKVIVVLVSPNFESFGKIHQNLQWPFVLVVTFT